MTVFRVTNSNVNKESAMVIQGSPIVGKRDVAAIIMQKLDLETSHKSDLTMISMRESDATGGGELTFKTKLSSDDEWNECLYITGSNVGIGVADPSHTLDVNGTIGSSSWKANTLLMCDETLGAKSSDITVDQFASMAAQVQALSSQLSNLQSQINDLKGV